MSDIELLKQLQGTMSQQQFAELLGVNQSTLSRVLAGSINPSRDLIAALVRTFPNQRAAILDVFFSSEYVNSHPALQDHNGHAEPEAQPE